MRAGDPVTVVKHDASGKELWRYEGRVLAASADRVVLEANFNQKDQDIHGLSLRRGDRFVETHYRERWYNVFAVHDADSGELKGWYCNVSRPARFDGSTVSADDLALDLVVNREGQSIVLDQEEFNELELSAPEREQAVEGLRELQRMAAERQGPFRPQIIE